MSSDRATPLLTPTSTVDALVSHLENSILLGELAAGERLRESVLAQQFGFARHTVRAALARLEYKGLVESTANKGWSVRRIDDAAAKDINFARMGLEAFAYSTLARDGAPFPPAVTAAIEDIQATLATDSIGEILSRDFALHGALVDAVGSPRLSAMYESLLLESRLSRVQSTDLTAGIAAGLDIWKSTHLAIAAAIQRGDEDALSDLMIHHTRDWVAAPVQADK